MHESFHQQLTAQCSPAGVARDIHNDAPEPGLDVPFFWVESCETAERTLEGCLGDVLGLKVTARRQAGELVDPVAVAVTEFVGGDR